MSTGELSCRRCSSAIAADDLRCPVCNLSCPTTKQLDRPEIEIDILRCSGCGAAMTYEVRRKTSSCAFCGSVLELESPTDPLEEAQIALPFTIDRERARAAFRDWLHSLGWFRPGDLSSEARLETIQPLCWVGWVFDARATVSWAADTNLGSRRSEWAPHAGRAELVFDDVVVPATRGLTHTEAFHLLASYDLSSASGPVGGEDDATIERFDIPRSTARAHLIEVVERLSRRRLRSDHISGNRIRNLHTSTVLEELETRRVAFPAWVLAYRYKNRLFRTVLSGQDDGRLMGDAPYSALRIFAAIAAGSAGLLILLALLGLLI